MELELVGVCDYIHYNIWVVFLMGELGYEKINNTIYQDNQSAILMDKNGKMSSKGQTRHIIIIYLFLKDMVDNGE